MIMVPLILAIFKYSCEHVSVIHGTGILSLQWHTCFPHKCGDTATLLSTRQKNNYKGCYSHLNKCCHFLKNQVPLHLIFSVETMCVVFNFI